MDTPEYSGLLTVEVPIEEGTVDNHWRAIFAWPAGYSKSVSKHSPETAFPLHPLETTR